MNSRRRALSTFFMNGELCHGSTPIFGLLYPQSPALDPHRNDSTVAIPYKAPFANRTLLRRNQHLAHLKCCFLPPSPTSGQWRGTGLGARMAFVPAAGGAYRDQAVAISRNTRCASFSIISGMPCPVTLEMTCTSSPRALNFST